MSKEHVEASKNLHQKYPTYGLASHYTDPTSYKYGLTIPKSIANCKRIDTTIKTLLDHGTGNGGLPKTINSIQTLGVNAQGYDPAVEQYSLIPSHNFDIVTSIDVLEHISKGEITNILDEIHQLTGKFFFFCIDLIPALKYTDDNRNAHFLIAPSEWWIAQIKLKFNIVQFILIYKQKQFHYRQSLLHFIHTHGLYRNRDRFNISIVVFCSTLRL